MTKNITIICAVALCLASCMKSATCTCKDSSGKIDFQQTKKSSSKKDIEAFKEDCKSLKYSNGSGTCELT